MAGAMRSSASDNQGMYLSAPIRACARYIDALLTPNACVFCGMTMVPDEVPICPGCHADLPWAVRPALLPPSPLELAIAPLEYEFPLDAAIKAWKFHRRLEYTPAFVAILVAALRHMPDRPDVLLPVPLHWRRQAMRGFNQAAELAKPLGRQLGLPVFDKVARVRHTPFQSALGATDRRRNLSRAFRVRSAVEFRHVVIVDDVITTGETTKQLARALRNAGAGRVSVLAIARAA